MVKTRNGVARNSQNPAKVGEKYQVMERADNQELRDLHYSNRDDAWEFPGTIQDSPDSHETGD